MMRKIATFLLTCVLLFSFSLSALASTTDYGKDIEAAWKYIEKQNTPKEYTMLAAKLAGRSPSNTPASSLYIQDMLSSLEGFESLSHLGKAFLDSTLMQYDIQRFDGHNLLISAAEWDLTKNDDIYGPINLLLAINYSPYEFNIYPFLTHLLEYQQQDGGFSNSQTGSSDLQATCYALIVLEPYLTDPLYQNAVDSALGWLSTAFTNKTFKSSTDYSLAVIAAQTLKVDLQDSRFCLKGKTLLDHLYEFRQKDGGFSFQQDQSFSDQSSSELAIMALYSCQKGGSPFDLSKDFSVKPYIPPMQVLLRTIGGSAILLALVYIILLFTNRVGKKYDKKPVRFEPESYEDALANKEE